MRIDTRPASDDRRSLMQVSPSSSLLHAMSALFQPQGPRPPAQPVEAVAPVGRGQGQSLERKAAEQEQQGRPQARQVAMPPHQPEGPPPRRGSFVDLLA